jgi:hypothetical protein
MNLFSWIKSPISAAAEKQAAPRVKRGQLTLPSFLRTSRPNTQSALPKNERNLVNTDVTTYRTGSTSSETIRSFVRGSPDLSAAVTSYVRTGVTKGYTGVARNPDGTVNREATQTLAVLMTNLDLVNDYTIGFDDSPSIRALAETWSLEILQEGAMSGELVLDKALLPYKIQPVSTAQIKLRPSADGKRLIPWQQAGDIETSLDQPTFFMVRIDQDTTAAYPESPIEPALQAVLFGADFLNDLRRIVKRALHPRMVVTLNEERIRQSMPDSVKFDEEEALKWMNGVVSDIEGKMEDLKPEDVVVLWDSIGVKVEDHGNTGLSQEYRVVQDMIDAKMATGAKVLPTVLGHSGGTSNVASSETLLFMKYVEGTVWSKLNEMFSKMFTLAVRLFGYEVAVTFQFDAIDLRPESELEAFKAMEQSRVLEQLSLGLITDDEACIKLTGHLPPAGYVNKSGTGFRPNTTVEPAGNGYNGETNSGSTLNQSLKSDAPKGAKSQNGGKQGAEIVPLHG